jgi:hypothetical protein
MHRFFCPVCVKQLKVPEGKAGKTIICPRCNEPVVVPAEAGQAAPEALAEAPAPGEPSPWLLATIGPRLWCALAAVTSVALFSVGLALLAPARLADLATPAAMVLVPSSFVLILFLLHGHATGCPLCGKWWTRRQVETEFVDRRPFQKNGVPYARSTYRTCYACSSCEHRWSVTRTEEYKDFIRTTKRPRHRLG